MPPKQAAKPEVGAPAQVQRARTDGAAVRQPKQPEEGGNGPSAEEKEEIRKKVMMDDLGQSRRDNLPLEGVIVAVDMDELERSKRAFKKGTEEWRIHQRDKEVTNMWKTELVDKDVPEHELGLGSGQSHRQRMVNKLESDPRNTAPGSHHKEQPKTPKKKRVPVHAESRLAAHRVATKTLWDPKSGLIEPQTVIAARRKSPAKAKKGLGTVQDWSSHKKHEVIPLKIGKTAVTDPYSKDGKNLVSKKAQKPFDPAQLTTGASFMAAAGQSLKLQQTPATAETVVVKSSAAKDRMIGSMEKPQSLPFSRYSDRKMLERPATAEAVVAKSSAAKDRAIGIIEYPQPLASSRFPDQKKLERPATAETVVAKSLAAEDMMIESIKRPQPLASSRYADQKKSQRPVSGSQETLTKAGRPEATPKPRNIASAGTSLTFSQHADISENKVINVPQNKPSETSGKKAIPQNRTGEISGLTASRLSGADIPKKSNLAAENLLVDLGSSDSESESEDTKVKFTQLAGLEVLMHAEAGRETMTSPELVDKFRQLNVKDGEENISTPRSKSIFDLLGLDFPGSEPQAKDVSERVHEDERKNLNVDTLIEKEDNSAVTTSSQAGPQKALDGIVGKSSHESTGIASSVPKENRSIELAASSSMNMKIQDTGAPSSDGLERQLLTSTGKNHLKLNPLADDFTTSSGSKVSDVLQEDLGKHQPNLNQSMSTRLKQLNNVADTGSINWEAAIMQLGKQQAPDLGHEMADPALSRQSSSKPEPIATSTRSNTPSASSLLGNTVAGNQLVDLAADFHQQTFLRPVGRMNEVGTFAMSSSTVALPSSATIEANSHKKGRPDPSVVQEDTRPVASNASSVARKATFDRSRWAARPPVQVARPAPNPKPQSLFRPSGPAAIPIVPSKKVLSPREMARNIRETLKANKAHDGDDERV